MPVTGLLRETLIAGPSSLSAEAAFVTYHRYRDGDMHALGRIVPAIFDLIIILAWHTWGLLRRHQREIENVERPFTPDGDARRALRHRQRRGPRHASGEPASSRLGTLAKRQARETAPRFSPGQLPLARRVLTRLTL
ncbi:MAG: hypothetical protein KGK10_07045 [Rhodospirillales bacterium]|nr:hypothetical protein [Rhodospirillales bacterium]